MEHVNYDRWFFTTVALADLLPSPFRHLDAACGTATLVEKLRTTGWDSVGIDLSASMLWEGRKKNRDLPLAVADLRALPFTETADIATCLFDSLNFLLDEAELAGAIAQLYGTLRPGGILYADIITERMVTEHFEGQQWEEVNSGFTSRWVSHYDYKSGIAESQVRVNTGNTSVIRERVYPPERVRALLEAAGFRVLAMLDAETWKAPRKKTTRIDFVAVKGGDADTARRFETIEAQVREWVCAG
jgi:SAM-dependent methyltransferase